MVSSRCQLWVATPMGSKFVSELPIWNGMEIPGSRGKTLMVHEDLDNSQIFSLIQEQGRESVS